MGFWKNKLPSKIWNPLNEIRRNYFPNKSKSYSGEGEDLILAKIFNNKKIGFYIDIGCYHPKINSNTYYFYKNGWRGINIDANPISIEKFKKFRKRDLNINSGVSLDGRELTYYQFEESAINTFSNELFEERKNIPWVKFKSSCKVQTNPLSEILNNVQLPQEIDFMDIDVEGFDMEVLKSNNWNKVLPKIILIEEQNKNINSFDELESFKFLNSKGYSLIAKTFSTVIFIRKDFLNTIK